MQTHQFLEECGRVAIKRYLANVIRERMQGADKTWILDQIIEFQAPEAIETVQKLINGFFPKTEPEQAAE